MSYFYSSVHHCLCPLRDWSQHYNDDLADYSRQIMGFKTVHSWRHKCFPDPTLKTFWYSHAAFQIVCDTSQLCDDAPAWLIYFYEADWRRSSESTPKSLSSGLIVSGRWNDFALRAFELHIDNVCNKHNFHECKFWGNELKNLYS